LRNTLKYAKDVCLAQALNYYGIHNMEVELGIDFNTQSMQFKQAYKF